MSYADMPTWAVDTLPTQRVPKRSFQILPAHIEKRPKMVQTQEQYHFLYQCIMVFIRQWMNGADIVDGFVGDRVLDAGVDNFGFEHVKL